ncbi:hypothetical protein L3Q82_006631 [Scortum barcoo]|uniref:Uncharacterized protein n=1 Tax=Scortum barcoo TaxID=214431 RepID=A0ACB8X0U4_9TELE|nr:hypothetical protein L3Q82_006631 [Scortum barcoo]
MCFVDLEKAFDRVPRGILSKVGCSAEYRGPGAFLRAVRSLYDEPEQELGSHCRQRIARGRRESGLGTIGFHLCCFADDDVVLLASSSSQDLQHVLERFAAECEAAGMRISTSKSWRPGHGSRPGKGWHALALRVGGEVLPQVEEFKYLGVLFTRVRERWSVRLTEKLGHSGRSSRSRAAAPSHREESAEVAWASVSDAPWTPP